MANPLESEASDKSVLFGNAPDKGVFLARLFRHRRTSYKFFWFLAVLELVRSGKGPAIPVSDVLRQMAALAWHPVCFYRLSLGSGDALQEKIRAFQATSALDNDSSLSEIQAFLTRTEWATEALRQCVKWYRLVCFKRISSRSSKACRTNARTRSRMNLLLPVRKAPHHPSIGCARVIRTK